MIPPCGAGRGVKHGKESRSTSVSSCVLLIDAYNVLHATGVLPPEFADIDLAGLVALLAQTRYAATPTTIVCDGVRPGVGHAGPSATMIGDVRVLYAGGGREADDEIERLLEVTSFASRLLVVSSDKRIQRAARRRRAGWTRSSTFLEEIARDLRRKRVEPLPKWVHEIPLGTDGVAHWMREFGLPEDWGPTVEAEDLIEASDDDADKRSPIAPASGGGRTDSIAGKNLSRPPVVLDDRTRKLIEEHAIDPDDLDMSKWM